MIETIVAMTILSIVSLAIMALAATSNRTARQAESNFQAGVLAQNLLERERRKNFADLPTLSQAPIDLTGMKVSLSSARAVLDIKPVPGLINHLKEIKVTLRWTEAGRQQSCERLTRVCDLRR